MNLTKLKLLWLTSPIIDVKIDEGKAKNLVLGLINPIVSIGLWLVPLLALIACIFSYISWLIKDEDEKERHKPFRLIKKIIIGTVIVESIMTIFAIFGIMNK